MANTPTSDHDLSFFLPTHFLTDDDFRISDHSPEINYPFPDYDFFTRQLAHSTRSNTYTTQKQQPSLFCPCSNRTGFSSPPVTSPRSKNDAVWDLLYEAAGQVARFKMNAILTAEMNHNRTPNPNQFRHDPRRSSGDGALGLPQSVWPALGGGESKPIRTKSMYLAGDTSTNRQSAGTGVFLPQRPGTQQAFPAEPRRKSEGGSPVITPARVAQALNRNLDEINSGAFRIAQPRFDRGIVTHQVIARRNSYLEHERKAATMAGHHEVSLPSDWTY